MDQPEARPGAERRAETLEKLLTPVTDAWVATASLRADGSPRPHMVPLAFVWLDERVVLAVEEGSRTARDIDAHGMARIALGPTRDVVMIEARLERVVPVHEAGDIAPRFASQTDWDPREDEGYVFLVLRPERIQAWRESNEIAGRELMRDGAWIT